uniref:BED-type domain-containing protein n=1 Tax=Populus alba TaxID=43335 RepID=A0A4U5MW38_POPAL|nr:hypothetical protein D5086_0000299320 [Populus alba]
MEVSNESAIKKPKRLTSVVWNHFQRIRKADVCYAVCVHCDKKLSGSSNSGTTHLRNHLMRCLKRSNYDVSQLLAAKKKKKDTSLSIANVNANYDETQRKDEYIKPTIIKFDHEQRKDEIISLGKNAEYLCLIAHYIDEDWKLQQKILNFVTLDSSHTEDMLSEVIINCLMEWDVECKLFAMTFDDCFADDDIVLRIKDRISQNRPLLSNGQLFDVRSAAHVLNLIVQDAMETIREVTEKVRGSVRYVKSSQVIQGKFNEIAQQIGISSQKNLVLDLPTRWNSTYFMLETVIGYKSAFCFLQERDPAYTSALTDAEWEWASSITGYLKLFVEITNIFSGDKCPTANIYFPEICDIYGSTALDRIKEVSDGIKELFNAYSICSTLVDQGSTLPGSSLPSTSTDSRDRLKGFDKFLHESSQGQSAISDLDKYLEEPVFPRNCDFNILNWWKVHTPRYPILSMMARDILGTPMSTIAPELAFGVGGRVLDSYRSSLNPDTRQALICTRDWLQVESEDHNPSSALALYVEAN